MIGTCAGEGADRDRGIKVEEKREGGMTLFL